MFRRKKRKFCFMIRGFGCSGKWKGNDHRFEENRTRIRFIPREKRKTFAKRTPNRINDAPLCVRPFANAHPFFEGNPIDVGSSSNEITFLVILSGVIKALFYY